MGSPASDAYCSYTKAIEHLGDRWSLLILRQLGVYGPLGFNALVTDLPGRISRSTLIDRIHRLEDLGLLGRESAVSGDLRYRLTAAGQGLTPVFAQLRDWAATWLPDDPAMVERDPAVLPGWLAGRVDHDALPDRTVVLEIRSRIRTGVEHRGWLVLGRGASPYGCVEDPWLDESRYLYVEAGIPVLLALATGRRHWSEAVRDGSVLVSGDPAVARALPGWFLPAQAEAP